MSVRRRRLRPLVIAQLAALGFVAGLLALLVWKITQTSTGEGLIAAVESGERPLAPAFDLPLIWTERQNWPPGARSALDDGRVRLDELRGTPIVLNFWASWCIPCKQEAPYLAAAATRYGKDIAFLGLDIQDFVRDAQRFLERLDVPYPSVRDGRNRSYTDYGLTGVPETFYIDAGGRIVAHSTGALTPAELERDLVALFPTDGP